MLKRRMTTPTRNVQACYGFMLPITAAIIRIKDPVSARSRSTHFSSDLATIVIVFYEPKRIDAGNSFQRTGPLRRPFSLPAADRSVGARWRVPAEAPEPE